MKGDFSRFTFDAKNRYSRVLMQQGRMQVDADWNEQLDISAYRTETEITDFIGQSGAPEMPQDEAVAYPDDVNHRSTSFRITGDKTNFTIGPGRYYVGGMLFENPQAVSYLEQPDYPTPPLHTEPGIYLAYLDVWQHHITALEAPTIREPALGGADTATRVKNVWQVKLHRLGEIPDKDKLDELTAAASQPDPSPWKPKWEFDKGDGQLTATLGQAGAIAENQLYRIEIHQGNKANETPDSGQVSFKWSRDNGAIAAQASVNGTTIRIKPAGQDPQLAFPKGQLIELSTQALALSGEPGWLATVQSVQGHQLTVSWESPNPEMPKDWPPVIVRRWDSKTAALIGNTDQQHLLEQSIVVKFEANKRYKTGDYWLIPARALTGNIEWSPVSQPPHGTQHRYCRLALVKLTKNKPFSVLKDCRSIFKPITSGLLSKAGDAMAGSLTIDKNLYIAGNVGVGTSSPGSLMSVAGEVTIGSNYVGFAADRTAQNGLLIEGNVGIGTPEPGSQLSVTKGIAVGSSYAIHGNAGDGSILVEGNVGIGTPEPGSQLSVTKGIAIGSSYAIHGNAGDGSILVEGNVGIGTPEPGSQLSVTKGIAVGSSYAIHGNAGDGIILVEGKVGIGTLEPGSQLSVTKGIAVGSSYAIYGNPEYGSILVEGNVGIGTPEPRSKLSVSGGVAIGSDYASRNTSPTDGLIVKGNVGIGTPAPIAQLDIQCNSRTGNHSTTVKGLYVTGDFEEDTNGVEFRHSNGTQGIGFGYNTIYAAGSSSNQNLVIKAKGSGAVRVTSDLIVGEKNLARPSWNTSSWSSEEKIEKYEGWKKIEALEVSLVTCGKPVLVTANLNCRTVKDPNAEIPSNTWGKVTIFRKSGASAIINLAGENDRDSLQFYAKAPEGQNVPISITIIDLAPAGRNTYYIACRQMEGSSLIGLSDGGGNKMQCRIAVIELT